MKRALSLAAFAVLALAADAAKVIEPLIGIWHLQHQELNGQKKESEPVTLRIIAQGDGLSFAFSVPVNNIDFVSMSYSAKLDGTEAEVKNARGEKIGTIRISASTPSHYKLSLKGDNRPDSTGRLSVSADGKTLVSEADSSQSGHTVHLVQTFARE